MKDRALLAAVQKLTKEVQELKLENKTSHHQIAVLAAIPTLATNPNRPIDEAITWLKEMQEQEIYDSPESHHILDELELMARR